MALPLHTCRDGVHAHPSDGAVANEPLLADARSVREQAPEVSLSGRVGGDDSTVWKRLSAIQDEVGRSRDEWRLLSLSEGDLGDIDEDEDASGQVYRCPWSRAR